jgi:TonB family protein
MPYRAVFLAFLLLLVRIPAVHAKETKWFEITSEHFLLFTDTSEAKGRRLISDFENRTASLSDVFGKVPPRPFPIEIFLFSNDQDFLEVAPRPKTEDEPRKTAYLLRGPDRVFIVAKDKSPDDIANDVGHALGHVLFERYVLWRPFWLTEGAAEYVRKVGRSPDTKSISEQDWFTAADVVTIVPSATYNDSDPGGAFRTESYRLMRLLAEEKPEAIKRYIQALRTGSEHMPAIDIDAQAMESALKEYVEKAVKNPPSTPAVKVSDADMAKLSIHRGDLLLATNRQSDANRWYNADSKDARAARAIITRFTRPPIEASRVLDRAARELPDNGLVQYHFGAMNLQDKKDIDAQVTALERAIQLLPLMGRAYAELARVYALDGQAEKSSPALAKALELEPEFGDHFYEIRSDVDVALGQTSRALTDIQIAADLPHFDRGAIEQYILKNSAIRKKIETARRDIDERKLEGIRQQAREEVERREPPPKPAPPPPPVPPGSITYDIETRAPIEILDAVYPDYPEALRSKGAAGTIAFRVDIGPDGKVRTAAVASSQIPDLNNAALEAIKKWSFKPGNRSIRVVLKFSLQ